MPKSHSLNILLDPPLVDLAMQMMYYDINGGEDITYLKTQDYRKEYLYGKAIDFQTMFSIVLL